MNTGTSDYRLPQALELDPKLAPTADELRDWVTAAAKLSVTAPTRSGLDEALDQVVLAAWRQGQWESGALAILMMVARDRGLEQIAMLYLLQVVVDHAPDRAEILRELHKLHASRVDTTSQDVTN